MYTIKEASARSGVGVPLLRAWERRYGVVAPTRTRSGYRLYDDEAILRLTAMRELISGGWAAQQAAEHVRSATSAELESVSRAASAARETDSEGEPGGPTWSSAQSEELISRLVSAARQLDDHALEAALDDTFGALRFEAAADRVLMPALRAIGVAWERSEVSVAGEHAASQAVLRRLAMAYEAAGDGAAERPVLVGLGPGARHEFGALAFATTARRGGLPVIYLGPDLPVEDWASAAVECDARAAVIGVPRRADAQRAGQVLDALRAARPGMVLAVGGAHAGRLARDAGPIELSGAMSQAVDRLRDALGAPFART